ncbi:helix-turn-helix transcriptional regulator [Candidatus Dojkabacteria bacterium]|nr:helix-turn-helix transcriptional regulator [Candidatus Dojkabacteria bacterium]
MEKRNLGQIIRALRKQRNISQFNLEMDINASFGSLSRIESGQVNPTKETLNKIAHALNLSNSQKFLLWGLDLQFFDKFSSVLDLLNNKKIEQGYMKIAQIISKEFNFDSAAIFIKVSKEVMVFSYPVSSAASAPALASAPVPSPSPSPSSLDYSSWLKNIKSKVIQQLHDMSLNIYERKECSKSLAFGGKGFISDAALKNNTQVCIPIYESGHYLGYFIGLRKYKSYIDFEVPLIKKLLGILCVILTKYQ